MGQIVTVTIGTGSYSVYALTSNALSDANNYFLADSAGTSWASASADDRKKALVTAFRLFERLHWDGAKQVGGQVTQFPRTGLSCDGESVPDGIPDRLVQGEFEMALLILTDPTILANKTTRSDVRRVQAGTAAVEFFLAPTGEETILPTVVMQLVSCFLSGAANSIGIAFASGVDLDSVFTDTDFERSDGLA